MCYDDGYVPISIVKWLCFRRPRLKYAVLGPAEWGGRGGGGGVELVEYQKIYFNIPKIMLKLL